MSKLLKLEKEGQLNWQTQTTLHYITLLLSQYQNFIDFVSS